MYRSHNFSRESDSRESIDSGINNIIKNRIYLGNLENSTESDHATEKNNESISDLFKQMSLKDRNSRILTDLVSTQNDSNASKHEFMTSSPIRLNSVMQVPIFTKSNFNLPKCQEEDLNDENKENIEETAQIKSTKGNKGKEFECDSKTNSTQIVRKPPIRSLTVRNLNKLPLQTQPAAEPKLLPVKNEPPKPTLRRSVSLYRSNASLNVTSKITIPKPFSFENKDKAMLAHRVKIVNDDLLEKKRLASAFRANPMVISSPNLPEKIVAKPTVPVSFKFESEDRVSYHQERNLLKSLADSSTSFSSSINLNSSRTNDISYLQRSPFMPKPSSKPVTIPETPQLTTKSRLEQRKQFDRQARLKELEVQKVRDEREQERLERERLECEEIRKRAKVKANPIRHYKKVDLVYSNKVTVPQTPKFSDRFKK